MTFEQPWALLALLAIPILIIIYILKNKYKEETAPSTYIWELSRKFLKKRNPLRKVEHLLALIIQIMTIAGLSFALSHPVFTLKGKADNIVFVLDASASMKMQAEEGKTRFDVAKDKITEIYEDAVEGSTFTLILTGEEPKIICEGIDDASRFGLFLDSVSVTQQSNDLTSSLLEAQKRLSDGSSNLCYVLSDRRISKEQLENITYVDFATEKANYCIDKADYTLTTKELKINGSIYAYGKDASIKVRFYADGQNLGWYGVNAVQEQENIFSCTLDNTQLGLTGISEFKAVIENAEELGECIVYDNTIIKYYNNVASKTSLHLVTEGNGYIDFGLKAFSDVNVTTVKPAKYNTNKAYDITIFDSYTPSELPATGAVWLINTDYVPGCGFKFTKTVDVKEDGGVYLDYAENTDDILYNELTKGIAHNEVLLGIYNRLSLEADFTTIMTYNNLPMVFAGKNDAGQREIVFSFDLHDSDFGLKYDWICLLKNFLDYSNPKLINEFSYEVTDVLTFAVSDKMKSLSIFTPDSKLEPLTIIGKDYVTYQLDMVGTYSIEIEYDDGTVKQINIFAQFPKEESNSIAVDTKNYQLSTNELTVKGDGLFDNILPIVIAAAIFFAADWILYAHEQY